MNSKASLIGTSDSDLGPEVHRWDPFGVESWDVVPSSVGLDSGLLMPRGIPSSREGLLAFLTSLRRIVLVREDRVSALAPRSPQERAPRRCRQCPFGFSIVPRVSRRTRASRPAHPPPPVAETPQGRFGFKGEPL